MEALGLSSSAKVWSAGALGTRCELLSNQRLENHMVCVGKHTALPQRNSVASKCGVYELLKAVEKKDRWGRKAFLKAGVARAHVAEKAASVEEITLQPIKTISGKIKLPGSKSLSNRTLLLAALSEGETVVENLLDSEDVRYMIGALKTLGYDIHEDRAENRCVIKGSGGVFPVARDAEERGQVVKLFLGNAGTAMRPLTAAVTAAGGNASYELDGVPRMRERPIVDLVMGLQQLGADVTCTEDYPNCPPVLINAKGGLPGGTVRLSGKVSSQYLSALLMAAPLALGDVEIIMVDKLVSVPYVDMTLRLMERFGVKVDRHDGWERFSIKGGQTYKSPGSAYVEGDASSASYFLAGAAVTGGTITVEGCGTTSLQGDVKFAEVLEKMGATVQWGDHTVTVTGAPADFTTGKRLKAIDVDMNAMPDVAMTLAVLGLFADGPVAIRDVENWRVKETERMRAIVDELTKLGAEVEEGQDYCIVTPPKRITPAKVDTYDDHRMAMAFSLAACGDTAITIRDPGCTRKTFPTYFTELEKLCQH
ncbi:3-phosphoshikimate 1-carboxyvinyltransferase 2 [Physcomitrium patens]|uniref:3-phosphoshikimate 1-carboxyvinyltransferase n=1 Tax=Physcomitrium patens TaxID=3218 RepID=A0A2K1IIY4_PHYPA|nr:3-phosphoshikimate 1-carboxyvinyltransferase 2-like [Physcomitrium patens]PNR29232.1 hypothetical protein PHYPA_027924 [Physcomitrium patens]|eukprot:XP_024362943.1 3-phosphoshikimate 1-carboxyvinyltransferase 2-like [Physcomitrella patens]